MPEGYFEGLYKTYYPEIYRYVLKRVQNEQSAEDVAQETFIEAYKSIDKVKICTSPRAWLITVAKRILYHRYQRPENRHTMVPLSEIADLLPDSGQDVCVKGEFKENLCKVLQEDDANLIVLLYEEGYSASEAAARFGLSLSACKMRIYRAREKIRNSDFAKEAGYTDDARGKARKGTEKPGKGNRRI